MSSGTRFSPDEPPTAEAMRAVLRERFGDAASPADPAVVARAPGRLNLLGGHTDYNGGFVLPMTINRAAYFAVRPRDDETVRLASVNFDEEVSLSLADPAISDLPVWARYIAGVAEEVRRRKGVAYGFEAVLYGDVPLGAGLSSSAALEVAVAMGLDALFGLDLDPVATAQLCQHAEHEYAGVECGIMDQFSSRLGRSAQALYLDCRSLDYQHVPFPLDDMRLVVVDSRVNRELAGSKYNERRAECGEAVQFFQQFDEEIETLRDVSLSMLEEHGPQLSPPLFQRARHVVRENERVQEGRDVLSERRLEAFGQLMNASHASLRDDYEVSSKELDCIFEVAQRTDGVYGSRMTGAGFGGCAIALVREEALAPMKRAMRRRFDEKFGHEPRFYVVADNLEAGVM